MMNKQTLEECKCPECGRIERSTNRNTLTEWLGLHDCYAITWR